MIASGSLLGDRASLKATQAEFAHNKVILGENNFGGVAPVAINEDLFKSAKADRFAFDAMGKQSFSL